MWLEGVQKKRVEIEVTGQTLYEAVETAVWTKFPRLRDHEVNCDGFLNYIKTQGGCGDDGKLATPAECEATQVLGKLYEILKDVK